MKFKSLLAIVLIAGGATTASAQSKECITNSSISHEAVKAKNYKDAYEPNKAVLNECPTLKYYTFSDAIEILQNFMNGADKKSADYKKYFDELMNVYDMRAHYIPEFATKMKGVKSVAESLADKAKDYLQYAPDADLKTAYAWLKESIDGEKASSKASVLISFLETSQKLIKVDSNHTDQFFQDYLNMTALADEALAAAQKESTKKNYEVAKENLVALFINSGVADCESLQKIYGPKVDENKNNQEFLEKTVAILKMMKCNESEAYFAASDYLYKINPTADAAIGVGWMSYKKGDYEAAVQYFDEGLKLETDPAKKAEMAYATAAALTSVKKYSQAKKYCLEAISYRDDFGAPYIMLAQLYASSPNWSDERALNMCTYFVCLDKLAKAKQVDPSCADQANELISTYSRYTPKAEDLFMLGIQKGDHVTVGGWIGESTTVR